MAYDQVTQMGLDLQQKAGGSSDYANYFDSQFSGWLENQLGGADSNSRYQFEQLRQQNPSAFADVLSNLRSKFNQEQGPAVQAGGLAKHQQDSSDARARDIDRLQAEYAAEMSKPLDMNDPHVVAILGGASQSAMRGSESRGVMGAASVGAGQRAYTDAAVGLDMQKRQMYQQAIESMSGRNISQQGIDLQRQQLQAGVLQQQAMAKYQQEQGLMRGIGAVGGATIGAIAGSAVPGLGTAAGLGAGAGIGAGVAGMFGSGPNYGPSLNSYGGGGGQQSSFANPYRSKGY